MRAVWCVRMYTSFAVITLLPVMWTCGWRGVGVEAAPTPLRLTVSTPEGKNRTLEVMADDTGLTAAGATKEELEAVLLHADAQGMIKEAVIRGQHIPIYMNVTPVVDNLFALRTFDGRDFLISDKNYTNASLSDFIDDPTLRLADVPVTWPLLPDLGDVSLQVTLTSSLQYTSITVNNKEIMREGNYTRTTSMTGWVTVPPYSGCYLRVINPYTGQVTLARYFNTIDHLLDQELTRTLADLKEGRLALLVSYYDASARLGTKARSMLHRLGSWAAPHLKFRDCWAWVWRAGGETLAEALVTNPRGSFTLPRPLNLQVLLHAPHPAGRLCTTWHSGEHWQKRHHFCDLYDGYAGLCSCTDPAPAPPTPILREVSIVPQSWWRENIAIVMLAGPRPHYLYRLLQQLLTQPGVTPDLVMVSVDGPEEETIKLAEIFGLRYVVHTREGTETSSRISRHLRFALFKALEAFEDVDKFIILEEDLILAPDFYSFMQQTSVLLEEEAAWLYGVSAFSHLSSSHTANDLTRLLRVTSFPSCGWMTTTAFLQQTLPKWPPVHVTGDWDFWMGTEVVRQGRELLLPEISRTAHGGTTGSHTGGSIARWYNSQPLSSLPHTSLNLTAVRKEIYEKNLIRELSLARPLDVSDPFYLNPPPYQVSQNAFF
ncbi:O-linked-mannose beta-1-2-N-acetylglucosaminyltransferase 1-like 26 [Homarus americanus]|uniref:Alpha-1,3-mannosyl-glycoprotein 2-beta-N-acetylglucosaminyltransferase n=1 Tax=Homarus americanus TaxID=6706 RepID=A0A8J5J883_HOMAM|nr:O-linked-mannose beta-1-2-N-acetylglucosaminyltransferase 1-like 26 [Homarus americanus]